MNSAKVRHMGRKLAWGARQTGVARATVGLVRVSALAIRKPDQASVLTKRNQLTVSFRYPSQLMPMLVVFQELLEPELGLLPSMLGPGRIALDVGASIGPWTMSAARTGATVHACEPDPESFEMLTANLRANGLTQHVTTYAVAMGQHQGWGRIVVGKRSWVNHVEETTGDTDGSVPITNLDYFVDDLKIDQVDVLKVNTAGNELAVLLGALNLFRTRRVALAMFLDGLDVRPHLDDLRAYSYDIGIYDGRLGGFVSVPDTSMLEAARPSPMNHYVLVRRDDVNLDPRKDLPSRATAWLGRLADAGCTERGQ